MNSKLKDKGLFLSGLAICFAVAGASVFIEKLIPCDLLGAICFMGLM